MIAANSMTLSLAVDTSETGAEEARVVHLILFVLAVVSLAVLGWPLARNTARAIERRTITVEAMFLAGIIGATTASLVAMFSNTGDVYFEVVSILLVVYAFGQQLTAHVQQRALRAAIEWSPDVTRCIVIGDGGRRSEIPVAQLRAGQTVFVPAGAMIAADGIVAAGHAFVREAEMTGEPFAVVKRPGDQVWAGTICVDASLEVRASTDGRNRRIDRIVEAVDRARLAPSSLQSQADRLVSRFLPTILLIAAATFVVWRWIADWQEALFNSMAVLLVACPCALGLATPLAVWVAIGRFASRGLVVNGGDAVEALASVDIAVFDKTGTVTEAETRLVDVVIEPPTGIDRAGVLRLVEAAERSCSHPVASAFRNLAPDDVERAEVERYTLVPAVGIRAVVVDSRSQSWHEVSIGSAAGLAVKSNPMWLSLRSRLARGVGARTIAVLIDGAPAAAALVDERLLESWPAALGSLRDMGLETAVMTGDTVARARLTAADQVLAGLTPERKLSAVRRLRRDGRRVLFVGDGVNDAAAMAESDVSIGVAGGTDLAAEVANMVWHGRDVRAISWAVQAARETVTTIRGNLVLAAGYNLAGVTLAVTGMLHPVAAALLMTCSSVVVTWRAMAGLRADEDRGGIPETVETPTRLTERVAT